MYTAAEFEKSSIENALILFLRNEFHMAFDKLDKTQPFTFIAVLETAVQNLRYGFRKWVLKRSMI
jgi:hypothetical protein